MVYFLEKWRKLSTESVENCQLFLRKCVKWPTLAGNSSFLGFLLQKAWKIVIFLDVANQLRKVWKMVYFFEKCVKWTTLVGNKVIVHFHAFCRRFATESLDNGLLFWECVASDLQKVWKSICHGKLWKLVYFFEKVWKWPTLVGTQNAWKVSIVQNLILKLYTSEVGSYKRKQESKKTRK